MKKLIPVIISIVLVLSACSKGEIVEGVVETSGSTTITAVTPSLSETTSTTAVESVETSGEKESSASDEGSEATTNKVSTSVVDKSETSKPKQSSKPSVDSPKAETGLVVTYNLGDSWEEGGSFVSQFDFTVKNNSNSSVKSWEVKIPVPSGTAVYGGWNGNFSISGSNLVVKNESYNGEISANGEVTFGVQLKNKTKIKLEGSSTSSGQNSAETKAPPKENGGNQNSPPSQGTPSKYSPSNKKAVQDDDWLFVKGNKIVDKSGKEVWLTGINWFGYNTGTNIFDGLWNSNLEDSLQGIADKGFNLLRIPMSVELANQWSKGIYPEANYNKSENPNLNNKNSLEIFDYVVDVCQKVGLKIMIDMHSAETDAMGHMAPLWYTSKVSTEEFYKSLEFFGSRYKNNDTIIAYDLKNEPHGAASESQRAKWDNSKDADNWKYIAETAASRLLAKNPNVLIVVEGIQIYPKNIKTNGNFTSKNDGDYYNSWWGGNLRGVKDNPINLGKYQNKLVYSPHDYGPAVHRQPWFEGGFTYDSLIKDVWRDNWLYIHTSNTAPLLIGEWGGFMEGDNLTWLKHIRTLIKTNKLHHTYWCYNDNSGDTGGMITGDWKTWDMKRYEFVKEVLWQKNGKFVGLDHKIPLGKNGTVLS